MEISSDFKELLSELNTANVKYLIVGAHAVGYHGRPRGTHDFDIWVERSEENAKRVHRALTLFGAPMANVSVTDFTSDDLVLQIGVEPVRIDVLTDISGVQFADAWPRRAEDTLEGVAVSFIGLDDLLVNKRASGRQKDLADVEELLKGRPLL